MKITSVENNLLKIYEIDDGKDIYVIEIINREDAYFIYASMADNSICPKLAVGFEPKLNGDIDIEELEKIIKENIKEYLSIYKAISDSLIDLETEGNVTFKDKAGGNEYSISYKGFKITLKDGNNIDDALSVVAQKYADLLSLDSEAYKFTVSNNYKKINILFNLSVIYEGEKEGWADFSFSGGHDKLIIDENIYSYDLKSTSNKKLHMFLQE